MTTLLDKKQSVIGKVQDLDEATPDQCFRASPRWRRLTHSWRKWLAGTGRSGRAHCRCSRPARSMRSSQRLPAGRRPTRWSIGTTSTARPRAFLQRESLSACARSISWWRSSPVGSPTGVTARRTGNGRRTSGKASRRSLCRVATPTCWDGMTANRRRQLTATTRPGSVPSSVASIPIGSSHLRFCCRRGRPVLLRLKRILREQQSCRSLPAQHRRFPLPTYRTIAR